MDITDHLLSVIEGDSVLLPSVLRALKKDMNLRREWTCILEGTDDLQLIVPEITTPSILHYINMDRV